MKNNKTEIIFLLDRSGSMAGLENDTIGGFNALIERQCKLGADTYLTAVLFDDCFEVLWDGVSANNVRLTNADYFVRGCTALLDAIGKTILDVGYRLSKTTEDQKPSKVIFVITTDGMENASREFSYEKVKELIQHQQAKYNWEFVFMGANIDAIKEADSIGIEGEHAFNFEATSVGVEDMYNVVSEMVTEIRKN